MPSGGGTGEHKSGLGVARLPRSYREVGISARILTGRDERPHTVDRTPNEPTEAAQLVDRRVDLPVAPGVVQSFEDFLPSENRRDIA